MFPAPSVMLGDVPPSTVPPSPSSLLLPNFGVTSGRPTRRRPADGTSTPPFHVAIFAPVLQKWGENEIKTTAPTTHITRKTKTEQFGMINKRWEENGIEISAPTTHLTQGRETEGK